MIHVELDDAVLDMSFLVEVVSHDTQDTTRTDKQTRIKKHANTKLTTTGTPTLTRRARRTRPRQDQRRSDDY